MNQLLLRSFFGLEFLFDLFDIDTLGYWFEPLNLEGLPSSGRFCLVFTVLALQTGY